jgi:diguanylate cyclase (GGDEF)-like protein
LLLVVLGSLLARFRLLRIPGRLIALIGGAGGALRMIDMVYSTTYVDQLLAITTLQAVSLAPAGALSSAGMAVATAEALLCFGLASLLWIFRRYGLGQAACAVALLPSLGSGIGYLLGADVLFGHVPPIVLLMVALTGIALLGGTAHRGAIRVFLSRTISGRFGRQQILVATAVPVGLALVFGRLLPDGTPPLALAETVASVIVIAWITIGATALVGRRLDLKRHRAEAELRNLARHDPLTGLLNRRTMNSELARHFATARREARPITLMMCDLDRFKLLNDEHGHAVGDEVLRRTAERVSAAVRDSDLVFRYGGEEIAVLLDCGPADAIRIAEKIRESVKAPGRRSADTELPTVTISIGAATSERAQTDLGRILGVADERLYAAKDAGRDCVRHETLP